PNKNKNNSCMRHKVVYNLVHFFFKSRRRHTRWPRDWSSDVCYSDLVWMAHTARGARRPVRRRGGPRAWVRSLLDVPSLDGECIRSEDRRLGKVLRITSATWYFTIVDCVPEEMGLYVYSAIIMSAIWS